MTAITARGIVAVGVDGSAEAVGAAQWAVEAAHLRQLDVLVVCAYQIPTTPGLSAESIAAVRNAADHVVSDVLSQLNVPPSMKVGALVELASPVILLGRVSELSLIHI